MLLVKSYCEKIKESYKYISEFCNKTYTRDSTSGSTSSNQKVSKMEFDLKTALSLLPVMNNDVSNTKQLIDGVEYYDSILNAQQCKTNLINFVLKNRLSQVAKLKLKANYGSVGELVTDMRSILLPKKSPVALQNKLQNMCQEQKSVNEFGKEITEVFMNLTIAQADGNPENLKVLQPLNEKQAIKRFADGLRYKRLGTIIAARNFDSLKDAIQAAIDEELVSPSTSGNIMTINRGNTSFRGTRGGGEHPRAFNPQFRGRGHYSNYNQTGRGHPSHRGESSTFYRGRGGYQQ